MRYQLSCDRTNILDLDSSSPTKFSRHLIFHLPTAVFKNNIHAGKESLHVQVQGSIVYVIITGVSYDIIANIYINLFCTQVFIVTMLLCILLSLL